MQTCRYFAPTHVDLDHKHIQKQKTFSKKKGKVNFSFYTIIEIEGSV